MADTSGLRQRKKGDRTAGQGAPTREEDSVPQLLEAPVDDGDDEPEEYGYDGSDGEGQADERLENSGRQLPDEQEDDDASSDEQQGDYDDEEDGGEEDADFTRRYPPPPAHLLDAPEPNDTIMLAAGFVGFLTAFVCSALLPSFGVEQDHVMAGGMLSLLWYVMWMSFCPSCSKKKAEPQQLAPIEQITPQSVFIVTACIGTMLGGLMGGGLKHALPAMWKA